MLVYKISLTKFYLKYFTNEIKFSLTKVVFIKIKIIKRYLLCLRKKNCFVINYFKPRKYSKSTDSLNILY